MNGFGLRRPRAPSIANGFSGEPEGQSTTSATDVKVEHTRERLVTPRAGVLSADVWPSKACGRQSTGYPAGSRAPALPVTSTRPSFGTRHERPARIEVGTLVGRRNRSKTRRGLQRAPCPKARLRPTARTVMSSNEPGCLHVARNPGSSPWPLEKLQRSPTKASIFHASDGTPWTEHTAARAAEKPSRWLSMRSERFACGVPTTFCETCRSRADVQF
jgi:hypothetical protein